MPRKPHPKPDIEKALQYAEGQGWEIRKATGHAWGVLYCPYNDKECRCGEFCKSSISSTPKNIGNHAKQIRRVVDKCTSRMAEEKNNKAD